MNFIAKHLNLIGLLLLVGFASATAAVYLDVPGQLKQRSLAPAVPPAAVVPAAVTAPAPAGGCGKHEAGTGAAADGCCATEGAPMHEGCPHEQPAK